METLAERLANQFPPKPITQPQFDMVRAGMLRHLVKVENRTSRFDNLLKTAIKSLPDDARRLVYPQKFPKQIPGLVKALADKGFSPAFKPEAPTASIQQAVNTINYDIERFRPNETVAEYISELLDAVRDAEASGPLLHNAIAMMNIEPPGYPVSPKPVPLHPEALNALSRQLPGVLLTQIAENTLTAESFDAIARLLGNPLGEQGLQRRKVFLSTLLNEMINRDFVTDNDAQSYRLLKELAKAKVFSQDANLNALLAKAAARLPSKYTLPVPTPAR